MFRFAHLSDLHLGPLPTVSYRQLFSKRITGYVNWQRNRRKLMHGGVIESIVSDIEKEAPDHVVVTGDLMNLALDVEIELSTQWLKGLGAPDEVSVIPGNHDAYVPGALKKACRAWKPWMTGEDVGVARNANGFPYIRIVGPVAFIGVSSARATAPFIATGHLGSEQARRMGKLLDIAHERGLFRVVLIHHPPVRGAAAAHKRLYGISLFQKTIFRHGAELVLHGHTHLPTLNMIAGRHGQVPVAGVAAAGQGIGGDKPPAQYNLVTVEGRKGEWTANLDRKGLVGQTGKVALLSSHRIHGSPEPKVAAHAVAR